jgi:hypothetical protein
MKASKMEMFALLLDRLPFILRRHRDSLVLLFHGLPDRCPVSNQQFQSHHERRDDYFSHPEVLEAADFCSDDCPQKPRQEKLLAVVFVSRMSLASDRGTSENSTNPQPV